MSTSELPVLDEHYASLVALWAKKYVQSVASPSSERTHEALLQQQVATKIIKSLPFAMARGLAHTEQMLTQELHHQGIHPNLIDGWQINEDCRTLFTIVSDALQQGKSADSLSATGSRIFKKIRRRYTQEDGRILGFVTLQIHMTSQFLTDHFTPQERACFAPYQKVVDDHLYMPIYEMLDAAAQQPTGSMPLRAVEALLPQVTTFAQHLVSHAQDCYPKHRVYSGLLLDEGVMRSSLRDAEMFQIYLCLCALQHSAQSICQELFPLCVMLYPRLNVSWELVRSMLEELDRVLESELDPEHYSVFVPHLDMFHEVFSQTVVI